MGKRVYNILFNLHTVSGIVISVALYVIFFAGSFSFFRDEIVAWERNEQAQNADNLPNEIDRILKHLDSTYILDGRDIKRQSKPLFFISIRLILKSNLMLTPIAWENFYTACTFLLKYIIL